jgi:hypothetical protein
MKNTFNITAALITVVLCLICHLASLDPTSLAQRVTQPMVSQPRAMKLYSNFQPNTRWRIMWDLDPAFPNGSIREGGGAFLTVTNLDATRFMATVTTNEGNSAIEGHILSGNTDVIYFRETVPGRGFRIYSGRQFRADNNTTIQGSWYGTDGSKGDFLMKK